ncbi:MAG TPA: diguanylate cyclase [Lachnospiraceae bacterium]|nr:diguanylate cyclase [Lachnospiraceae bacterium]
MLKTESAVLFAVFGILTVFIIIMVEKKEISRIVDLTKSVQAVSFTENRFPKISVGGKDEIALLGKNINCMLMELEKNYDAIKKNNEHLYHAMEVTNDGYFDYDITNQTIDISQTWLKYLGYENNLDLVTDIGKVLDGILPEDRQRFEEALHAFIQNGGELFYEEVRAYKAQHGYIWVLVRGGIIEYDREGNAVRFVGSLSDITKRKENENQKIFLLQTDPVTGLKNRAYMEKKLEEYKQEEDPVFSILMADVNGLKLINDAFGHREGDRLLKTIGDIITYCCDDADIPVRWGGDEFLVLVRNNRTYAENLMRRIKYELDLIVSFPIKISVAAGCSAYKKTDMDMEQVISRAEEKMYRNKLLESRSFHNGIIVTLEQTLYEKKIELPAAIERRQKICRDIGKQMHLSQETLDELDLLNLLHDIGKIELPDDLIFKTGGMTEEEIGRKKKHTETGYRIVKTIPEIAHIANSVLYHHESFDGSGYPTGISGDEIPITSRIFSVVNYFDFLTNRNGQNSVGQEEAKQMVMEKAGSKFDPEVVSVFIKVTEKKEYMD